jgi:hypothetical protein
MKRTQPGWLVLVLAGVAALIGSFRPFYTFDGAVDLMVWDRSLFPVATIIPLFLAGIGLEAMAVLVLGHEPRSPFLNFTWSQARLAGSAFAMLLALAFLVQGRAGASLGSGYLIMSVSAVASFGGAVMTRRAELARRREEIVKVEHPWRVAMLRWRKEMAARMNAYASGGSPATPRVQPVPEESSAPVITQGEEEQAPAETVEEATPEPTPLPRLSAVHSEPESEPDVEPEPEFAPEVEPEPEAKVEAAADVESEVEVETALEPGTEVEPEVEPTAEVEPEIEPMAEVEPKVEPTAETEPGVEVERDLEPTAETEREVEIELGIEPAETTASTPEETPATDQVNQLAPKKRRKRAAKKKVAPKAGDAVTEVPPAKDGDADTTAELHTDPADATAELRSDDVEQERNPSSN